MTIGSYVSQQKQLRDFY